MQFYPGMRTDFIYTTKQYSFIEEAIILTMVISTIQVDIHIYYHSLRQALPLQSYHYYRTKVYCTFRKIAFIF